MRKRNGGLGAGAGRGREVSETDSDRPSTELELLIHRRPSDPRTFVGSLLVAALVPDCGYS